MSITGRCVTDTVSASTVERMPRHLRPERAVAARGARPERREIRREAFRQPEVRPLALGHGVAEPLVRGLVRDRARRSSCRAGRRRRRRRSRSRSPFRRNASTTADARASRTGTARRDARTAATISPARANGPGIVLGAAPAPCTRIAARIAAVRPSPHAVSPRSYSVERRRGDHHQVRRNRLRLAPHRLVRSTAATDRPAVASTRACRSPTTVCATAARARATSPSPCRSDDRCSESSAARDSASCRRSTSIAPRCRAARSARR